MGEEKNQQSVTREVSKKMGDNIKGNKRTFIDAYHVKYRNTRSVQQTARLIFVRHAGWPTKKGKKIVVASLL